MPAEFQTQGLSASRCGSVVLALYTGITDAEQLSQYRDWLREKLREVDRVHNVSVVVDAPSSLDAKSRAVAQELTQMFAKAARSEAIVMELGGLKGSFIRAIVAGLHMVTPSNHPRKVFQASDAALSWVATQDPQSAGDADLARQRLLDLKTDWKAKVPG